MRLLLLFAALCLIPFPAFAQDDDNGSDNAIHAVTTIHEDGTKTVSITNPDTHSSEATTYDAGGRVMQKVVYSLDDQNQPASGIIYAANGRAIFKATYKRDGMNRISEEDDYTMDDQLIRRFVYEFGANGKVSRIRAFDSQGNELQQTPARKDERQSPPFIHQ